MKPSTGREQDPSALEEELVAYLDDELDEEARRLLERRLTEEPTVRESLRKLTRVWDALETLPRAEVSDSFATTTVEAVVLKEQESQANTFGGRWRKNRDWWLKAGVALAACALVSFVAARLIFPDPNAQLAADLPILENIDAYRSVESIEFARMLAKENLFPPSADASPQAANSVVDADHVAARVTAMTAGEKAAVASTWQKFEGVIGESERERLRALERALQQDPDQAELRRVMVRYHEWLGSLKQAQQQALRDLSDPPARLKRMREMILADLPDDDRRIVHEWIEDYAHDHEDELVKRAELDPKLKDFPRVKNVDDMVRHWKAMGTIVQCLMEPKGREDELPFTQFDFAQLEDRLSAEPSKRLQELEDLELKKLALAEWWRAMMRDNFDRPFRGFDSRPDAREKYTQLFDGEEGGLRDEDKNRIFMLPPDEASKELAREWAMRFGGQPFGRHGFGPPGPPPDDRGGRRGGGGRGGRGDRDRDDDNDDPRGGGNERRKSQEKSPASEKSDASEDREQ